MHSVAGTLNDYSQHMLSWGHKNGPTILFLTARGNAASVISGASCCTEANEAGCLRVPLILRKILEHISNTELVTFSLVNKQWNYEARCVTRDRGSLIASLKIVKPCRDLEAFLSDLRQMNIVPFSGIRLQVVTIDWLDRDECNQSWLKLSSDLLRDSIQNLGFNRLKCKYFHLIIHDRWGCLFQTSLALMFVRKVLNDYGEILEEFVISPESRLEDTLDEILKDRKFPNLKILTFKGLYDQPDDEKNSNVIQTVISSSPNLQEVHSLWSTELENILQLRSVVAVPYTSFHAFLSRYSESFIPKLRLKHLNMDDIDKCSIEKFNRIVPLLLKTSRVALQSLTMNPAIALPIMGYGICLENVTKLKIDIGRQRPSNLLQPRVVRLLRAFDFFRIFPKLDKVIICSRHGEARPGHIREFVRQGMAVLKKPMLLDRAANVKELVLFENCLIEDEIATLFAEMFPKIQRLSVEISKELEASCMFIWEHWKDMKELEIKFERKKERLRLLNLDSVFCGINPEEVAELREKDDEYLKCVNIVPVRPSFTCLKNLRRFVFVFQDNWDSRVGRRKSPEFLFSRVTGWIAFARSPALLVTIEYSRLLLCTAVLRHMKPFASVVPIDYKKRSFVPD